ncbi:hypothetical protein [Halomonas marinisediminis]|nr:hypothetical protein [Halomonas marinisediminis]
MNPGKAVFGVHVNHLESYKRQFLMLKRYAKNTGVMKISSVVAVFLISLQSFYFHTIGASLLTVFGSVLLLATGLSRIFFSPRMILFLVAVFFFFTYHSFVSIYSHSSYSPLFSFVVTVFTVCGAFFVFSNNPRLLTDVLGLVISIHIFFYLLQVVYWFTFGEYLDFLEPVTGDTQRYSSQKGMLLDGERVPRFTGLFNEPGSYSTYLFSLAAVRFLAVRKLDRILIFALASMVLSFSLFGIVLSFLFLVFALFVVRERRTVWFLAPLFLVAAYVIFPEVERRLSSDFSGLDGRFQVVDNIFILRNFLYGSLSYGEASFAANDTGVFLFLLSYGGIGELLVFLIVVVSVLYSRGWIAACVLIMILSTKIKINYPMLWFVMACIVIAGSRTQLYYNNASFKNVKAGPSLS